MNLRDKINEDLKAAMKSGDKIKLETVRSLRALILEYEKSGNEKDLGAEDELKLLTSAAKKRNEAIEQYEKAGRQELVEKEKTELEIIRGYLPKQLSSEELLSKVKEIATEIGASTKADFSKLMPESIKRLKGQADGKEIKTAVEKVLGN